jgi:hypothetical protein
MREANSHDYGGVIAVIVMSQETKGLGQIKIVISRQELIKINR